MRKLTLEELRAKELNLLNLFDEFCKKNTLSYFLAYGTLLGAVRHKGFIPWDDDIDVCMLRPDYERFLSMRRDFESENSQALVKKCGDKGYPFPFTKIEDKTTLVHEHAMSERIHTGVWIDIFPFDGFRDSPEKNKKLFSNEKRNKKIIQKSLAKAGAVGGNRIKRLLNCILIPLARLYVWICRLPQRSDEIAKKNSFDKCNSVGTLVWAAQGTCNIMKKENVFPLSQVLFCDRNYPAPKQTDIYLSRIYGNYMQLPPEKEQVTHLEDAWEL